jgi:hypothetical protein
MQMTTMKMRMNYQNVQAVKMRTRMFAMHLTTNCKPNNNRQQLYYNRKRVKRNKSIKSGEWIH